MVGSDMPAVDYDRLAPYYDRLVIGDEDVAFFTALSRTAGGPVVELMAGTGRVSVPVASAGVALTCVDSSRAMLDALRRKLSERGVSANVVEQDVTRLDLPSRFDLAFIAFHSFEEIVGDIDRRRLLDRLFAHLSPGAKFVCTLHDPPTRARGVGPDREWRFDDPETGRSLRLSLSTTFERGSSLVRGRERIEDVDTGEVLVDLALCFRLTSRDEFRALADGAGFVVEALHGDYAGGPYLPGRSAEMVWVLSRPAS